MVKRRASAISGRRKEPQPAEDEAKIVADGTEDDVGGVAGDGFDVPATEVTIGHNRSRKSAQCDRWSFYLTTGRFSLRIRRSLCRGRPFRNHTRAFEARALLAAIKGDSDVPDPRPAVPHITSTSRLTHRGYLAREYHMTSERPCVSAYAFAAGRAHPQFLRLTRLRPFPTSCQLHA